MGQTGKYFADLEAALGKGRVTSGYRTQKEQDALVAAGKTKAKRSSHTYSDGYDFAADIGKSEAEVRKALQAKGFGAKKLIYETGKGKNQGTGAHWHAEGVHKLNDNPTTQSGKPVVATGPGRGIANPEVFLDALKSKLAPESKASQNVKSEASAIFNSDAELAKRGQAVEQQLGAQGQAIDILSQVTEAAQDQKRLSMQAQVNESRAISNEIVKGTTELKKQVTPVFQARQRIADQLDQLNTMNPLERGIRGIFDLNYDKKYLESQLDNFDRTLKTRRDDFNYIGALHDRALQEIGRRHELNTAMTDLETDLAKEDLGVIGMRLTQTAGMLGNLKDTISTQSQLIQAKNTAREDMMGRLDTPTLTDLANQAKTAGGVINYGGVELNYGELRKRLEAKEQQDLNVRLHQIAAAKGELDLAESVATNIARSLTREQTEAAIAQGGVWNGIQLPNDVLASAYQNHIQMGEMQAKQIATTLPASMAYQAATDSINSMVGLYSRASGMFGKGEFGTSHAMLNRGSDLARRLTTAVSAGAPPEVIATITAQIAENTTQYQKAVDATIERSVGGDKRAAGYLKGFVYGTPMNAGTAGEALTYFAMKGSLPQGMGASPEAKAMFQQAQSLIEANQTDPDTGKKRKIDDLHRVVTEKLTKSAAITIGGQRFDRLYESFPEVAKRVGHPFGKLSQGDWSKAVSDAQLAAATAVGRTIGVSASDVLRMKKHGKLDNTPEGELIYKNYKEQSANFNAVESTHLADSLNMLAPVQPGVSNSDLLLEFASSPQANKALSDYGQRYAQDSLADYLFAPFSAGAAESTMNRWAKDLKENAAASRQLRYQETRKAAQDYQFDPFRRAAVSLSGVDGVGAQGAKVLAPLIKQFLIDDRKTQGLGTAAMEFVTPQAINMEEQDEKILRFLQSSKFQDPVAEKYRKAAAAGYEETRTRTDGIIDTLLRTLNPL